MLFAHLLSLHLVTFLMFFILVMNYFYSKSINYKKLIIIYVPSYFLFS